MIRVAVGIIRENGKILVCQRKKSGRYGMKWEFPGGKIEGIESAAQCLKRELKEELGIDAEIGNLYHHQQYTYPDNTTFEVFYHNIPSFRGAIENRMFESIRWTTDREIGGIDMLEGNRDVVQKLVKDR